MVTVVGGQEAGVLNSTVSVSSFNGVSNAGVKDQGSAIYVNAANSNVIYASEDSFFVRNGDDFSLVRTYNSQGEFEDQSRLGGKGRWRLSSAISLSEKSDGGEVYYEVVYGDGSVFDFRWNADSGQYESPDGQGAFEVLVEQTGPDGSVTGFKVLRSDLRELSFNGLGQLTRSEDNNGNYVDYEYTGNLLATMTDRDGTVITFTYDSNDLLQTVTRGDSEVLASYTYENGYLSTFVDRKGDVTQYQYDASGNLEKIIEPTTAESLVSNVTELKWSNGIISEIVSGPDKLTISSDEAGSRTITAFHAGAQVAEVTVSYDQEGRITQVMDGESLTATVYKYDEDGNVTSIQNKNAWALLEKDDEATRDWRVSLGYSREKSQLTTDEIRIIETTNTVFFTYDNRGNVLSQTDLSGAVTNFVYNADNQIKQVIFANGGEETYEYDASGFLERKVDVSGDITTFIYDSFGRVKTKTEFLSAALATGGPALVTQYEYDDFGQLKKVTDPEGVAVSYFYDIYGNLTSETDAKGNTYYYTYDADNRLETETGPTLNSNASRATFTAVNVYDNLGNLTQVTIGSGDEAIKTINVYDASGRLLESIQYNSNDVEIGREDRVYTLADSNTETIVSFGTTGYVFEKTVRDDFGNILKVTRGTYESFNTTTDEAVGESVLSESVFVRDAMGRLLSESVYDFREDKPGQARGQLRRVDYVRDASGNVIEQSEWISAESRSITLYAYDELNQLVSEINALGVETRYDYDLEGNVTRQSVYDFLGEKIKDEEFQYDALGRLVAYKDALGNVTRTSYDGSGNVAAILTAEGRLTVNHYDEAGNLSKVRTGFAKNAVIEGLQTENFTIAWPEDQSAWPADNESVLTKYEYWEDGLLKQTTVSFSDGTDSRSTYYEYDGLGRQTLLINPDGKTAQQTVYDARGNIKELREGMTRDATTDRFDPTTGRVTSYSYYDQTDYLKSITSPVGVVQQFEYDALGNIARETQGVLGSLTESGAGLPDIEGVVATNGLRIDYTTTATGDVINVIETDLNQPEYVFDQGFVYALLNDEINFEKVSVVQPAHGAVTVDQTSQTLIYTPNDPFSFFSDEFLVVYSGRQYTVEVTPQSRQSNFEYDQRGNLTQVRERQWDGSGSRVESWVVTHYTYNELGQLIREEQGDGESVTDYRYDELGNQTAQLTGYTVITEGNPPTRVEYSSTVLTEYDAMSRVAKITNPLNGVTTFDYDGDGNLISESRIGTASTTRLYYDGLNRVVGQLDAGGYYTAYELDSLGNQKVVRAFATKIENAGPNPPTPQVSDSDRKELRTFDSMGRVKTFIDARGLKSTFEYDSYGNLKGRKLEVDENTEGWEITAKKSARIESWTYYNSGLAKTYTRVDGTTETYEYDSQGNTVSIRAVESDAYEHHMVEHTDSNTALRRYNAWGQETHQLVIGSYSNFAEITWQDAERLSYDLVGNVIQKTDARGYSTYYYYDALNRLTDKRDPLNQRTEYRYTGEIEERELIYDANGTFRSLKIQQYDGSGNAVGVRYVEADGISITTYTQYQYDAFGNLIRVTDANGHSNVYEYDEKDQRIAIIDALDYAEVNVFNAFGERIESIRSPSKLTLQSNSDSVRTALLNKSDLITTTYGFNKMGQEEVITYPQVEVSEWDSGEVITSLGQLQEVASFDAWGNLVRQQLKDGSFNYFYYDILGQRTGAVVADYYIGTTYDYRGNVIRQENFESKVSELAPNTDASSDPLLKMRAGKVTESHRAYDANNSLIAEINGWVRNGLKGLSNNGGPALDSVDLSPGVLRDIGTKKIFTYDATGNLILTRQFSTSYSNPFTELRFYDALNRLNALISYDNEVSTIEYDVSGNVSKLEKYARFMSELEVGAITNAAIASNNYDSNYKSNKTAGDAIYHVANNNDGIQIERREYNGVGWLKAKVSVGSIGYKRGDIVTRYDYDLAGNLTKETIDNSPFITQYEYDQRSSLIKKTTENSSTNYQYDYAGRLIQEWVSGTEYISPGTRNEYDALGRLIATNSGSGVWREFALNANGHVLKVTLLGIRRWNEAYETFESRVLKDDFTPEDMIKDGKLVGRASLLNEVDSRGKITKTIDVMGLVREYKYDFLGREIERSFQYDSGAAAENGQTTYSPGIYTANSFKEDFDGTSDPVFNATTTVTTTYDGRGNRVQETWSSTDGPQAVRPEVNNFWFDTLGRLLVTQFADGNTESKKYLAEGVTEVFRTGAFETDFLNINTSQIAIPGSVVKTTVDALGNTVRIDRGANQVTSMTYDRHGRLATVKDGKGAETEHWYDARGNQIITQDANGNFFVKYYNADSQLTQELSWSALIMDAWHQTPIAAAPYKSESTILGDLNYHPSTAQEAYEDEDFKTYSYPFELVFSAFDPQLPNDLNERLYVESTLKNSGARFTVNVQTVGNRYEYYKDGKIRVKDDGVTREEYHYNRSGLLYSKIINTNVSTNSIYEDPIFFPPKLESYSLRFSYDVLGLELTKSSEGLTKNINIASSYYRSGKIKEQVDSGATAGGVPATTQYVYYRDGLLKATLDEYQPRVTPGVKDGGPNTDQAGRRLTFYQYDFKGRVQLQGARDLQFFNDNLWNEDAALVTRYDINGNQIVRKYQSGATTTKEESFEFDAADRIKKYTTRDPEESVSVTYDAAGRIWKIGDQTREYDKTGRLSLVSNGETVVARYLYDSVGNVKLSWEAKGTSSEGKTTLNLYDQSNRQFASLYGNYDASNFNALENEVYQTRKTVYLVNPFSVTDISNFFSSIFGGEPIAESVLYQSQFFDFADSGTKERGGTITTLDRAGRVVYQRSIGPEFTEEDTSTDPWPKDITYRYTYGEKGRASLSNITAFSRDPDDLDGQSKFYYDANGELIKSDLGAQNEDGVRNIAAFSYDHVGNIIQQIRQTARFDEDGDENGTVFHWEQLFYGKSFIGARERQNEDVSFNTTEIEDTLDLSGKRDPTTASNHTVVAGDTLKSISQQYFGSPSYWHLIADRNGLSAGAELRAGATLFIPSASDSAYLGPESYNLVNTGDVIGSNLPNLTAEDNSCAQTWAIILVVIIAIVAVVATIVTVGAAAPAIGAAIAAGSYLTAAAIVVGVAVVTAAIAAIGNVLTQGTLISLGLQEKFDTDSLLADVAVGGLSGALGAAGAGLAAAGKVAQTASAASRVASLAAKAGKISSVARLATYVSKGKTLPVIISAVSSVAEEAASAAIEAEITGEPLEFGVRDVIAGIAGEVVGTLGDAAKASVRRTGSITKSVSPLSKRLPSGVQNAIKRVASRFSKVLPSSSKEFDLFADDAAEVFAKQIKKQSSIPGRILSGLKSKRLQEAVTSVGAKFSEVAVGEINRDEENSGNFLTQLAGAGVASVLTEAAGRGFDIRKRPGSLSTSETLTSRKGFNFALTKTTRFGRSSIKGIDIIDDIQSKIDLNDILEPYFQAKSGDA